MPTYEYACTSCGNEWEAEQSIKDPALTECPRCHEQTARRQISRGTGFILKGGGWYSDLYASTGNKKPDTGSSGSGSGGSSGSSGSGGSSGSSGSGSSGGSTPSTPSTPSGSSSSTTSAAA